MNANAVMTKGVMKMSKVISICTQKGGVAKTTSTANLGVALARQGNRVLLVDFDPQADLTICFGYTNPDALDVTISTMMLKAINEENFDCFEGIKQTGEGVCLIPSNLELSALEMSIVGTMNRERVLSRYLDKVKRDFDYVLIDCPPSLSMITINALSAADSVIIPVQAHYLPAKGMEQLINTVERVRKYVNPNLKIDGVLMTLVDNRTNFAKEVPEIIRQSYGNKLRIFDTQIPMRIKAAETPARGVSIFSYDPKNDVAKAYDSLSREVIRDVQREKAKLHAEYCR